MLEVDRGLAPSDGGEERDGDRGLGRLGLAVGSLAAPGLLGAAASHPVDDLVEDPASAALLLAGAEPSHAAGAGIGAEEGAQVDVLEPGSAAPLPGRPLGAAGPGAERASAVEGGVAELVVALFFLGVREDVVGVLDFLELLLGRLVAGIGVRVVLAGEPSIRLLDLFRRRVPGHAQDLVIISVGHRIPQTPPRIARVETLGAIASH